MTENCEEDLGEEDDPGTFSPPLRCRDCSPKSSPSPGRELQKSNLEIFSSATINPPTLPYLNPSPLDSPGHRTHRQEQYFDIVPLSPDTRTSPQRVISVAPLNRDSDCGIIYRRQSPPTPHTMKVFSSTSHFDYDWEHVSTANWQKYSPWNEKSTHVIAVDTLSRHVDASTGIVRYPQRWPL